MQAVLRVTLVASAFLLPLFHAGSAAAQAAACGAPVAIASTHTKITYPAISQRMGERGSTRLAVGVGADGTVREIALVRSSGSKRLDDMATAHIGAHYRWQPLPEGCGGASNTVAIAVNWWLDPLPNPAAATATEGLEVIDVRAACIHIWAYDGPVSSSGSGPCRVP